MLCPSCNFTKDELYTTACKFGFRNGGGASGCLILVAFACVMTAAALSNDLALDATCKESCTHSFPPRDRPDS